LAALFSKQEKMSVLSADMMWPTIQLLDGSGADCKVGLTVEPPLLDLCEDCWESFWHPV